MDKDIEQFRYNNIVDDINIKREGIHPVKWMHGERFYTLDETYSELKKWAEEEATYEENDKGCAFCFLPQPYKQGRF